MSSEPRSQLEPRFRLEGVWLGKRAVSPRKMLAWLGLTIGIVLEAFIAPGEYAASVPFIAVSTFMILYYYTSSWANLWAPPAPFGTGTVTVDDATVSILADDGKSMSLPLSKLTVRNAWQEQRGFVAHFKTAAADAITVTADRPEVIQALLRATGERVLLDKMRLSSWVQGGGGRQVAFGCLMVTMFMAVNVLAGASILLFQSGLASGIAATLVAVSVIAALIAAADRGAAEPELIAGSDGLQLRGSIVRRSIRYRDLAWAKLDPKGIRLGKRSGSEEVLGMWRPGMMPLPDDPNADAIDRKTGAAGDIQYKRARVLARIQAGIAATTGGTLGDAQLALLDRGDQDVETWRDAMQGLLAQNEGTYRSARLDPHALASVLESTAQPLARRIGATLALRNVEDPELQERVRFAVESCVDDRLRHTLERATQGEVAAEAMAELESEAAAISQRGVRRMRSV